MMHYLYQSIGQTGSNAYTRPISFLLEAATPSSLGILDAVTNVRAAASRLR
ncbi:hypothetical protein [Vibrio cholerae]|uniref:hypothetical protein n=1 Tax=Vibrio cholerae TaxID=666 RepID=UPI0013B45046|nr:hypothetical protein [Vibrio cholerae]